MAFSDDESGESTAQPVELYRFTGTLATYLLTSFQRDVTIGADTYDAVSIERSAIKNASQDQEDVSMEVSLPFDHPMVQSYVFQESPPSLEMEIRKAHRNNLSDSVLIWKGEVTSFSIDGIRCSLKVPSKLSFALEGVCPARKFQGPCNHILYDGRCKVVEADNKQDVTILSIVGNLINFNETLTDHAELIGGEFIWPDGFQRRTIIASTSGSVTLSSFLAGLEVDTEITVNKGCNRSFDQCKSRFNNGINFSGFPYVPELNPFKINLNGQITDAEEQETSALIEYALGGILGQDEDVFE